MMASGPLCLLLILPEQFLFEKLSAKIRFFKFLSQQCPHLVSLLSIVPEQLKPLPLNPE